ALAGEIDQAIVAESARWGDLMRPSRPYTREDWLSELANLRDHFFGGQGGESRATRTLSQFEVAGFKTAVQPPVITAIDDPATGKTSVTVDRRSIFAGGDIVFTLDGSDPRMEGGSLRSTAMAGPETLGLDRTVTINARAYLGDRWSALAEMTVRAGPLANAQNLRLTEVMYHPAGNGDAEFIEIQNQSDGPINLAGATLRGGVRWASDGGDTWMEPGAFGLLVRDLESFRETHGAGLPVLGQYEGKLSNSGERVALIGAGGLPLFDLTYSDSQIGTELADGKGRSLVVSPTLSVSVGPCDGGTPGKPDRDCMGGSIDLLATVLGDGATYVQPVVRRRPDGAITLTYWHQATSDPYLIAVEGSRDLTIWTLAEGEVSSVEEGPGRLRTTMAMVAGTGGETGYFRIRIAKR
ncbi:MAG: hypothetical protein AAF514_23145, partial [Verrucomicrobiota bacterium]